MSSEREQLSFQAEVRELLNLMIHSLYSHREIFSPELIPHASDANDKLRFLALSNPELLGKDSELAIWIDADPKAATLTVSDHGIGMSREEAITHLGTIAKSGTAEFFKRLTGDQQKDAQLIGQFGVGFYSAFIVADRVEVVSRRADLAPEQAVRWESTADGQFTVETITRAERGTSVVLHLKDDAKEFADPMRLRALVRRYSDHIAFPVRMQKQGVASLDYEDVNQAQALWTRPRSEIKDEEYRDLYGHIAHDGAEPLAWSHNRVEGKREYTSLLYIPARAPFDLWQREATRGLKLYVRRVFIMDDAGQFPPLRQGHRGLERPAVERVARAAAAGSGGGGDARRADPAGAGDAGEAGEGRTREVRAGLARIRPRAQGGPERGSGQPRAAAAAAALRQYRQCRQRRDGKSCRVRGAHATGTGANLLHCRRHAR